MPGTCLPPERVEHREPSRGTPRFSGSSTAEFPVLLAVVAAFGISLES